MISKHDNGRMVCVACVGMGKARRATCAIDPVGKGHTLVHLYDCRTCGGDGWASLQAGPPT